MKTIKEFCREHGACQDGREWALENCKDMQEAWETAKPEWVIWMATRDGVLTDKELRLFAVFCARQNQHLLTDKRSLNAIDVAERFANGEATQEELDAARDAAWAAADAAWDATRAAAWAATRDATRVAAGDAARNAARAAARNAARDAAELGQANWLRDNTSPCFGE